MNKKALVEAALFVSDTPLTIERIVNIVGAGDEKEVEDLVFEIRDDLKVEERGVELVNTPDGFEFRIKKAYREDVAKLAPLADLSDGMLRTLAIVAVRQPIKQSLIVKYQGNKAYDYIRGLEGKGLVRTEKFGRTKIVTTTSGFEKYFGTSTEELRKIMDSALALRKQENEEESGKESLHDIDGDVDAAEPEDGAGKDIEQDVIDETEPVETENEVLGQGATPAASEI